jgi:pimeloyl-ACP methyl ester carboxylesterase
MPYCEVADGVALYYEDFGEGSPVVFTNAGNLTHKMWMGQVAALAPAFRTITYDIRGTGFSAKPRFGYTADAAAAELCVLVEKLNLGPVTMAAHGIGTHVVLLAAAMRPDLVSAIVLVSGGPWFSGERDGLTAGLAAEFLAFLTSRAADGVPYADICEEMIRKWLFARPPSAGVVHYLLEQALAWPKVVLTSFSASMHDIDHRGRLSLIVCPAMVIHGRQDRKQLYEGAQHITRLLPNARLITLERSAHMGQIEEPNEFNHALWHFVRDVEAMRRAA